MNFNLKYIVLACTMAAVIVTEKANVLVAAELRGTLVPSSSDGTKCIPGNECNYNTNCLIGTLQVICNSPSHNKKGTFFVRNNNPTAISTTAPGVPGNPPSRRLDTPDVVFSPGEEGGSFSSVSSSSTSSDNGAVFTAAKRDPCPIQITLDSRSSSKGGGPVRNGSCSGYTGGRCDYSRDNKRYARCDCQRINNGVEWRCYPNP